MPMYNSMAVHTVSDSPQLISEVMDNRQKLLRSTGFRQLITLNQTHSDIIHKIDEKNISSFNNNTVIEGDGLITDIKGILLGILTADCVPVLYYCPDPGVVAIVHAGWKGIHKKIHIQAVERLVGNYNCTPESILVTIAPHIRECCYEVGPEFLDHFPEKYFQGRGEKYLFDMTSVITDDLKSNSVLSKNIFSSNDCVFENANFFSYRRGDIHHRNLSFIGIK